MNNTRTAIDLIYISEWVLGPEDLMQFDLLSKLPPSGGNEDFITAGNIFLGYAFGYPVYNSTAVSTAKVFIDIMTSHAYLPTVTITDKESVFVTQAVHEVVGRLVMNLKHAKTKHA